MQAASEAEFAAARSYLPGIRQGLDGSSVGFDHAPGDRQPKTSARSLGGDERLEKAIADGPVDSRSGVHHVHLDGVPDFTSRDREKPDVLRGRVAQLLAVCSRPHCFHCIAGEVVKHAEQLLRIDVHRERVSAVTEPQIDLHACLVGKIRNERACASAQLIKIRACELQCGWACKQGQIVGNPAEPCHLLAALRMHLARGLRGGSRSEQVEGHRNPVERVLHLVRDGCSRHAHRREMARRREFLAGRLQPRHHERKHATGEHREQQCQPRSGEHAVEGRIELGTQLVGCLDDAEGHAVHHRLL